VLHELELIEYTGAELRIRITCSRGTYARVLADEVATALGSAGHLSELCRERSGPFLLEDAVGIDELTALVAAEPGSGWREVLFARRGEPRAPWRPRDQVVEGLRPRLCSDLAALSHLPLADVSEPDARRIRNGGSAPPPPRGTVLGSRYLVVCGPELVAVAENASQGPRLLRVA
jgi:tRNA U55 pseudouridine synthase TruB